MISDSNLDKTGTFAQLCAGTVVKCFKMSIIELVFLLLIVPRSFIKCRDLARNRTDFMATKKVIEGYFDTVKGGPDCDVDDFRSLLTTDQYFIDKSFLIKEIIAAEKFLLIVRPRKWGKSINLSMLRDFYALEVDSAGNELADADKRNKMAFAGGFLQRLDRNPLKISPLIISRYRELMRKYRGKHPAITLDFRGIFKFYDRAISYADFLTSITNSISEMYEHHRYLKPLHQNITKYYRNYARPSPLTEAEIVDSLPILVDLLYERFNKTPVFVSVDEYFAPITVAQQCFDVESDDYAKVRSTMDAMLLSFSRPEVNDSRVEKMIMTGTLDVIKMMDKSSRSAFRSYSSVDERFAEYYGFTEDDVEKLYKIRQKQRSANTSKPMKTELSDIKSWYGWYAVGKSILYNPVSIKKCLANDGQVSPYWMETGNTRLLDALVDTDDAEIKSDAQKLVFMDVLNVTITPETERWDIVGPNKHAFYSRLLYSGYLSCQLGSVQRHRDGNVTCSLRIPNAEIRTELLRKFNSEIVVELPNKQNVTEYLTYLMTAARSLYCGDIPDLVRSLQILLRILATRWDIDRYTEQDYHRFMSNLVMHQYEFVVKSTANASERRYDHLLIPHPWLDIDLAVILAYKVYNSSEPVKSDGRPTTTANPQSPLQISLIKLAEEAANRAIDRRYFAQAMQIPSIKTVHVIGIAFSGQQFRTWDKHVHRVDGFTTMRPGTLNIDEEYKYKEIVIDPLLWKRKT